MFSTLFIAALLYVLISAYLVDTGSESNVAAPIVTTAIFAAVLIWWVKIEIPHIPVEAYLINIPIYLGIGIGWSFFKWLKYVKYKFRNGDRKPLPSDNIEHLSSWILWWPFSMIHYIFGDLLKDICNRIIKTFSKAYEQITNSIYNQ